jgi:hypothetical protein
MIIDPLNPKASDLRDWQRRDMKFRSVTEDFTVYSDAKGYSVVIKATGQVIDHINTVGVSAPYTNYQRGVLAAKDALEVTKEAEVELELAECAA